MVLEDPEKDVIAMDSNVLIGYFAELGLDVVKNKIKSKAERRIVRDRIAAFIEEKRKENFYCTIEEEIDFCGLANYIRTELIEDVKLKFFGTHKERRDAYDHIMKMTAQYAKSKTHLSYKRAQKIVTEALNILTEYYRPKTNQELRFLSGEIEDFIEEKHQESLEAIQQVSSNIAGSTMLSVDRNLQLAKAGRMDLVQENLTTVMNAINSVHVLKPYYGYAFGKGNTLRSVPLMPESVEMYPPSFDISAARVKLGDTSITKIDSNLFQKAYNHQIPIYFDVVAAKKYLGIFEDPIQTEATEMIGTRAVVKPPEFPPAFPSNVSVGSDVIVDYLLLRTKEILDDGTVIITNDEQKNYNFHIQAELNPKTNKGTFRITPNNPTNRQLLKYRQFLQRANAGETVTIKILSLNQLLVSGTIDHRELYQLNAEIEFLQKIIAIEDYFKKQIVIPKVITKEDHIVINHLIDLINDSYRGSWRKFEFKYNLTEETKLRIEELTDQPYVLFYTGTVSFEIFDQIFTLPVIRKIPNAKVLNLEKTKRKSEVLDVGDEIKIQYVPKGEKGEYIDQIYKGEIE
jgi:hypothetical protein